MPFDEEALRASICEVARCLFDRGHNAPGDGNISARLSETFLLCTPTSRHKGRLNPDQIVKVHASNGRSVDERRPSSELRMHLAIYKLRADVHAVVHAHSPNTVALTVAGASLTQPCVPEAIQLLGSIPTVPYASPTTEDVAGAVEAFALSHDAFVLERHGPVALGRDLDDAYNKIEVIEHTAKITVAALAAGSAAPISPEEATRLRKLASLARA